MITQIERYRVERWKRLRDGRWSWIIVGFFNAASSYEARSLGRKALADQVAILRAVPVGRDI